MEYFNAVIYVYHIVIVEVVIRTSIVNFDGDTPKYMVIDQSMKHSRSSQSVIN